MNKVLIVVDMQNDFIDGSLGTAEAVKIVPNVVKLINEWEGDVICTYDTHYDNYDNTLEGKMLPVKHCVVNTDGWLLNSDVFEVVKNKDCVSYVKPTFGSLELMNSKYIKDGDEITICGLCTDICVISNALLLRAKYPNNVINVVETCCAGVTLQKHNAAIQVMESCQINIVQ